MCRKFKNMMRVLLVCLCAVVVIKTAVWAAPESDVGTPATRDLKAEAADAELGTMIARLESRYGIDFRYRGFPKPPEGAYIKFFGVSPQDEGRLKDYVWLFENEMAQYPQGFFKDRGVLGIGLVTHLFMGNRPAQGMYHSQLRIMFFDIARFSRNKARQRHSIHHEIFHMMATIKPDPALQADAWTALNTPGFSYGSQTRVKDRANPYNYYAPFEPGFVTYYSMESPDEDQAEIFACLMQPQHRRLIEQWILQDKILRKKVEVIRGFMERYHDEFR